MTATAAPALPTPRAAPPWHLPGLVDEIAAAVAALEAGLRAEQARHGLDEWAERALQQALGAALRGAHDVALEAHYPSTRGRKRTHRPRCDLVLTPRGRPLAQGETLPLAFCPPGEALWLELKLAHQLGVDGAHPAYGTRWRHLLVADLRKLAAEPEIRDAGLVLLAFTASEEVLWRDLDTFERLLAGHELLAGFRHARAVPVEERLGHRVCGVALWPTVQRGA